MGWQIQLILQNISEWWELQTAKIELPEFPAAEIPGLDQLVRFVGWAIALLLLSWFLWRLSDILGPYIYRAFNPVTPGKRKETPLIKNLSVERWLKRSRQLQSRGHYGEACRCLYMAMLQRLNDKSIIPHQPHLTDREYQTLLQQEMSINAYQKLLQTHEQFYFDNRDITSDMLSECQKAYREIERKS